ncbi:hypothetical protein N826_25415 [Skermanella aerolata KACC 11604]|nr:hypothetical protein N826_25415 [Skermanella aerolata KACC 11604]
MPLLEAWMWTPEPVPPDGTGALSYHPWIMPIMSA